MKKFLINILKYFFVFSMFIVSLFLGTIFIVSSVSYKISPEKNIIIVGDSHTESAIDDVIFSHAINISQSGTAYLYSYVKLRKFLEFNPHINKVLLSFNDISIRKSLDIWTMGDMYLSEKVYRHISFFKKEEIFLLLRNNTLTFLSSVLKLPKKSVKCIFKFFFNENLTYRDLDIGSYLKLDRNKLEKDIELRETNIFAHEEELGYQFDYLMKIVELCKIYNVELILINTPTYKSEIYSNNTLQSYYNRYFSQIKYLDFSDFVLPDSGYGDIEHLNYKGAEIFSQYLEDNYESVFESAQKSTKYE